MISNLMVVDEQFKKVPEDLHWAIAIKKAYSSPNAKALAQARQVASLERLKAQKKEALRASFKVIK